MMDGETLTIVRRAGYTINHIRPCTMEKGKKMAKVRLANPPKDIFSRLEKEGFDELKSFPELGLAKIKMKGKHIIVFQNGEITIRAADDREDILRTAEILANILKAK